MIDPRELRIGNWLSIKESEHDTTVTPSLFSLSDEAINRNYEYIPITEQWLRNFGFEHILLDENNPDEGYFFEKPLHDDIYCDLALVSGDKNGILEITLFPYEDYFRFQYVHEVQNIYKLLTGKELNLTSTPITQSN